MNGNAQSCSRHDLLANDVMVQRQTDIAFSQSVQNGHGHWTMSINSQHFQKLPKVEIFRKKVKICKKNLKSSKTSRNSKTRKYQKMSKLSKKDELFKSRF